MRKAVLALMLLATTPAVAIKDKDNQGRWEKRVENGPDKEVPGFLVNLGPTGARSGDRGGIGARGLGPTASRRRPASDPARGAARARADLVAPRRARDRERDRGVVDGGIGR